MSQPTLDHMPPRLYRATPTRLTTWLDCPRRYRFAYLDRPAPPKGPPWAHNTLGAVIHNALAGWWRLPRRSRTVSRAGGLVHEYWTGEGFRDINQAAQWRQAAIDMVEAYVANLDPTDEPRGVERTVGVVHGGTSLSGRIDRIDQRGDTLVIVDYKTGRHELTIDDAKSSLALAIYAVAAARTLRIGCRRVELHHLPTGAIVTWEHDDDTLKRHLDRANSIAGECASADSAFRAGEQTEAVFPARPSSLCGWCDYLRQCAEGQAVTSGRASWRGLPDGPPRG